MTPAEHARTQQPTLKSFVDNELPPWKQFAMQLHLARCAACREEMRAMQQIGEELRGQALDPLDPRLRSRILATVREMTPETVPSLPPQARRPPLVWGGAVAALLLIAVIASNFWRYNSPLRQSDLTASAPTAEDKRVAASSGGAEFSRPPSAPAAVTLSQEPDEKPERRVQSEKASAARSESSDAASVSTAQSVSSSLSQMPLDDGARQRHRAAAQPIVLQKAGFDLKGYQLVTQRGKRIVVPFKKSLNALRFARATDGRMTLAEASPSPVLALRPTDTLQNIAVPGCYWQPLLTGPFSSQPLYARPAPDWAQFVAMRWYPNMAVIGGLTSLEADDASFAWLPRSYIRIGATRLSDFIAYRAYAATHSDAFRLHAVYDSAPTPASAVSPRTATKTPGRLIGKPRP